MGTRESDDSSSSSNSFSFSLSSSSTSSSSSSSSSRHSSSSSSSSSDGGGSDVPSDEEREQVPRKRRKVVPYACDPSASSDESDEACAAVSPAFSPGVPQVLPRDDTRRLRNTRWCCCNSRCGSMPTTKESVCCQEQRQVKDKAGTLDCITKHPLFTLYCLNRDILDLEYTKLRVCRPLSVRNMQHINAKYRYTAYCQFVWWVYGKLGRENRVPLPSCVVTKVREDFPAPNPTTYKGFTEC